MFLRKEEIQKIATEIRKKLGAIGKGPGINIQGTVNRTNLGRKGGNISLSPGVSNPLGMQTGSQAASPLADGADNGKSTGKA